MVEEVSESYHNLRTLVDLLDLKALDYMSAFDLKLANAFMGLSTAASTYPCPWCELAKSDFAKPDCLLEGGQFRSLGSIREKALKFQAAKANHKGKTKLSSAQFKNCDFRYIQST